MSCDPNAKSQTMSCSLYELIVGKGEILVNFRCDYPRPETTMRLDVVLKPASILP